MKIGFVLAAPDISGGVMVIYKHALYLKDQGHDVYIIGFGVFEDKRKEWFPRSMELNWITLDTCGEMEFDITIATFWQTLFEIHRVKSKKYVNFVQSIESRFFDEKEVALRRFIDSGYFYDIAYITEATWIKNILKERFSRNSFLVKNGIDKKIFTEVGETVSSRKENKLRVLVEGPVTVPFKNVRKSVELCRKAGVDEIWLLTSSDISTYPGVDLVFSRVPFSETAKIYRSCDLIVKLSYVEGMFGPPLEMFHCGGTAIVYDVTGHDEYIVDGYNAFVVKKDDDDKVVEYINKLKNDKDLLDTLKSNALKTAEQWIDWNISSSQFEKALIEIFVSDYSDGQKALALKTEFNRLWYTDHNNVLRLYRNFVCRLPQPMLSLIKKFVSLLKGG